MRLFDWLKPKGEKPLLDSLLDVAAANDSDSLIAICDKNQVEIRASFKAWSKVPEDIRARPSAMAKYCEGLIAVAQAFDQLGDNSLLLQLTGSGDDNPVDRWEDDLSRANSLLEEGKPAEAVQVLKEVIERNASHLGGSAVDRFLPITFGTLSVAHFRLGESSLAIDCARKAKALCESSGDAEGALTYERNIRHISEQI